MQLHSAGTRQFLFAHLRVTGGGWQALADRIEAALDGWREAVNMGVFMGVFGLSNQEVFVLISLPKDERAEAGLLGRLPSGVEALDLRIMHGTVRPLTDAPFVRAGIHVFRFFDVNAADMDEIASLSRTAWETFETGEGYATEPMALFASPDATGGRGRMLLITWYDSMASWEQSRQPHPDATANFRRRAALSKSIHPFATRLAHTVAR